MKRLTLAMICGALISSSSQLFAQAIQSFVAVKDGDFWGLMDLSGRWRAPAEYEEIHYWSEWGIYQIKDQSGRVGILDNGGRWIFHPTTKLEPKAYGLKKEWNLIAAKQGDCWGYIDKAGTWVIPPQFENAENFDVNGIAEVGIGSGQGLINTSGKWIVNPIFNFISNRNKNGLMIARIGRGQKHGLINSSGQWIIKPIFDDGYYFQPDGWAAIQAGTQFGYLDEHGSLAFLMNLDELPGPFNDSFALASKDGKKGYINRQGYWIVPPILEDAKYPKGDLAPAKMNGKWGMVGPRGDWVIPPRFDSIGWFEHGEEETWASLDGREGFVSRLGRFTTGKLGNTTPDKRLKLNKMGWAEARLNGKWGVLDRSGRWLVPPKYACVGMCWDGPPPVVRVQAVQTKCMAKQPVTSPIDDK